MLQFWLCLAGAGACWLLFRRLAFVFEAAREGQEVAPAISVIIPARNEAASLPLLLADLAEQTLPPLEVLVVDDMSEDATSALAQKAGATLLHVGHKPAGWVGKSYACELGAKAARGELLLFLDADVRLRPGALAKLAAAREKLGCTVSVQPYHQPPRWYEQLSLFFNLIAVASLNDALPFGHTPGLFGPVIFIGRETYFSIGGHASVKASVVEDMSLGKRLDALGHPYRRLLGGADITFRMYPGGMKDLAEGYIKNFATGAAGTGPVFFLLVFLWVMALVRVPLELGMAVAALSPTAIATWGGMYLLLAALLYWAARKVGGFKPLAVLAYPVCLLFFVGIFFVSVYKKLLGRPVTWKGRSIEHTKGGG